MAYVTTAGKILKAGAGSPPPHPHPEGRRSESQESGIQDLKAASPFRVLRKGRRGTR